MEATKIIKSAVKVGDHYEAVLRPSGLKVKLTKIKRSK